MLRWGACESNSSLLLGTRGSCFRVFENFFSFDINTNQEQKPLLGPEKFFDLDTPLKCSESPLSIPLSGVVTERESSKNCQSFNGHV